MGRIYRWMTLLQRFQRHYKEDAVTGCWEWQTPRRYGEFGTGGQGAKEAAHRVAYLLRHAEIPIGTEVDHLCLNTRCVNPDHLEAVTHQVNVQRRYAARA